MQKIKTLSVRLPLLLWREIMTLIIYGRLRSINAAVIEGLELVVKKYS